MILNMYTDGACRNNQNSNNLGGWGLILEFGTHQKELYGSKKNTTNNQMELTAVIKGFKALTKDNLKINVFSDSSYVCNCFRQNWYKNWEKNGWKTSSKKQVENKELWQELISLTNQHNVTFYIVKGHINLNHPSTNVEKHFEKFLKNNGNNFSLEEFNHIISMNNRADALANLGIDEIK